MCGRFTLRTPATVLIEHFDLDVRGDRQLPLFEARYNIAPTQDVLVVRADPADGQRTADMLRWGLIPSWSQADKPGGPPMINARAETLAEKPTFRTAVRHRRCLIPADGFYEWQQSPAGSRGKKQPCFIHRPDDGVFAFAGLWETWTEPSPGPVRPGSPQASLKGRENSLTIESCTIVTTNANAALQELHERMPVVLAPGDYSLWLDPKVDDPAALQHLLAPCGDEELVAEPVGTHVNKVTNDDPRCIDIQRSLF